MGGYGSLLQQDVKHILRRLFIIKISLIIKLEYNLFFLLIEQLVFESNFHPYTSDVPHMIHSITKNVVVSLIGLAMEDGYIESVNQKMVDLLPELDLDNLDESINDITIEDLLTMQTAFRWGPGNASFEMYYESEHQLLYALERDMVNKPGEVFEYNSGATHILSVILTETTGKSTLAYAEEKIFAPLNIFDVQWATDYQGYYMDGDMMFMKARDMAKFGSLYLQQGVWDGEQLIPKDWIESATKTHVEENNYGYSWWVTDFGGFVGSGAGGQYLAVLPDEDMIVVITSGIGNRHYDTLNSIMKNSILSAVVSDEPIEENPEAFDRLQTIIEELSIPEDRIEPESLPETATGISGNTYLMDDEDTYILDFTGGDEAFWTWHREGVGEYEVTIGLDNVYRVNHIETFFYYDQVDTQAAPRGHWTADNTFILDFRCLENAMSYFYEFEFDGDILHHRRTDQLNNSVLLSTTGKIIE